MAPPSITYISPDSVEQDWEGTVAVHGSGFDPGSYPVFAGAFPMKKFINAGLLEADVTKAITRTSGVKEVKVHDTGSRGEISNSKDFEVKAKSARQ